MTRFMMGSLGIMLIAFGLGVLWRPALVFGFLSISLRAMFMLVASVLAQLWRRLPTS